MAVNAESEALRRSFSYLVNSIDTTAILPVALSKKLIIDRVRQSCSNEPDDYKKAEKFLSSLLRTVNGNFRMFQTFVQILKETSQSTIASQLEDELAFTSVAIQSSSASSSTNEGERLIVPDALVKELADLRFEFAKLVRNYENELRKSPQAQEVFVNFMPRLFRKSTRENGSFQSHYNTLVEEYISLFNIHYLRRICDILPQGVSDTTRHFVEQYEEHCQRFMNSTTVSQFRGLFPATATPSKLLSGRVPVILKLENEWDEYTIAELKTLTIGFSDQNNFLHLTKIEHGCIAVTWLSSTADVKQLKSAVIEAADSLKTMKVLQVFVGEELMLDHSDLYVMHNIREYEHSFVTSPPARCFCKLCNKVVCDAFQHNSIACGKVFCKDCVEQHKKKDTMYGWNPCPFCRVPFNDKNTVKDVTIDSEVDSLPVNCLNMAKGCKWKGAVKSAKNHLATCKYQDVECTNECGTVVQRRNLDSHLTKDCPKRPHKCLLCDELGEYQYITGAGHLDICPNQLIACPLCSREKKRHSMESHQVKCRVEPVSCHYQSVGCAARPRRQDLPQHNLTAMSDHLRLAIQVIGRLRAENAYLGRIVSMGPLRSEILKMENVSRFLNARSAKGRSWHSSNFSTNSTKGYTAFLRVDFNSATTGFVSCYISVTAGKHGTDLEWPFSGIFTVSILNHSESGKDYTKEISSENEKLPSKNTENIFGERNFIQFSELLALDRQSLYLKDNTLFFKVTVDNIQLKPSSPKREHILIK